MDAPGFYVVPGDRPLAHYFRGRRSLCGDVAFQASFKRWKSADSTPVAGRPYTAASCPVCVECQDRQTARWAGVECEQPKGAN